MTQAELRKGFSSSDKMHLAIYHNSISSTADPNSGVTVKNAYQWNGSNLDDFSEPYVKRKREQETSQENVL